MNDLISRQAAIDAECEVCQIAPKKERGHNCTYYVHGCKEIECLRDLPSAQPKRTNVNLQVEKISKHQSNFTDLDAQLERKKGEWIHDEITRNGNTVYTPNAKCSVCDCYVFQESNFCPNCGAEMRSKS